MQTRRDIHVIVFPERMNDKKSIDDSAFVEKMYTYYTLYDLYEDTYKKWKGDNKMTTSTLTLLGLRENA